MPHVTSDIFDSTTPSVLQVASLKKLLCGALGSVQDSPACQAVKQASSIQARPLSSQAQAASLCLLCWARVQSSAALLAAWCSLFKGFTSWQPAPPCTFLLRLHQSRSCFLGRLRAGQPCGRGLGARCNPPSHLQSRREPEPARSAQPRPGEAPRA